MISTILQKLRRLPVVCCLLVAALLPGSALAASVPFTDVPAGAWYEQAVSYVYGTRLMSGMQAGVFSPTTGATRGQIVTILYRVDGEPGAIGTTPFQDVPATAYYAEPVTWAYHFGIVNGVGPDSFQPNQVINREQMVTILFRFGVYKGWDITRTADISRYIDGDKVSDYARQSMGWAVGSGLLEGTPDGALLPRDTTTRAHLAAVFMRINDFFGLDLPVIEEPEELPPASPEEPKDDAKDSAKNDEKTNADVKPSTGKENTAPDYIFQWPVRGTISSSYGNRFIFGSTSFHRGIDIPAPLGTAIHAGNDGKVIFSGEQGSYGNLVVLDHGNGFQSYYAHNSKLLVKVGERVAKGQTIAACGSTGRSTGNHCHFEVHYNGELVNPLDHLPAKNDAPANTLVVSLTEPVEPEGFLVNGVMADDSLITDDILAVQDIILF